MADEDEQIEDNIDADGDLDEVKKGGKKKIIMILLPLLLLVGGGGAAYSLGYLDGLLGIEASEEDGEHGEEDDGHGSDKKDSHAKDKKDSHSSAKDDGHGGGHGEEGGDSGFLEIPPMIVNLNTQDGTPRYLRLTVQLELEDAADKDAVNAVMPRVVDQFQTYLRELRDQDLRGSAGVYRLQMELLWRVNQAVAPIEVKDVLFQEILIQ
jgi:flagellar FliL protein